GEGAVERAGEAGAAGRSRGTWPSTTNGTVTTDGALAADSPSGSEMLPAAARSRRSPSSSGIIAKATSAPTATRADSTVADSSRSYPASIAAATTGTGLTRVSGARVAA